MVKVVYFNQWFSSIDAVIADLRNKHGNKIKIIGSSRNADCTYKNTVDTFIHEDWEETSNHEESMNNYIQWVYALCKEYKVDYFFVKKHMEEVAKHSREFAMLGALLICDDYEKLIQFSKKSDVYDKLSNTRLSYLVPEYKCSEDIKELTKLVSKVGNSGEKKWCLKLNQDEGGASFRIISQNNEITPSALAYMNARTMSVNSINEMLKTSGKEEAGKLIFMEILDSPEISVDCYNSRQGFIALCRKKLPRTRVQRIYYSEEISKICEEICNEYKLLFPFNVQFRSTQNIDGKTERKLKLLEINTRMSGGTYYETLFGLNIADVCLCDVMHNTSKYNIEDFRNFKDLRVTHVEQAIKLD